MTQEYQSMRIDQERLFTAIRLPSAWKQELYTWTMTHRPSLNFAKWVDPEDYHITLQFLGDVPLERIPLLVEKLQEAAKERDSFVLHLGETGFFGRKEFPRILWRGIKGEIQPLTVLYEDIVSLTSDLGYQPEDRPYRPHITLARKYKSDQPVSPDFGAGEVSLTEEWEVGEFVLFATRMGKQPMYQVIEAFPFHR
ncbi:RNA 2',3'-cyclic phosphodiesterase [Paenibacillus sp. JX-17]|uniref:RNA 2',3'-cyclic phosphodiesterase n=1 Tax=Paenibacillus lacisoli TaxID=3064525 RepID=A0ABT9CD47_9BACL|nr:RNA 2',3'-cyclic phosphodiesterase [Paenibacillus sp. JX-17]MDO7907184.1 RNA 2',3'-cyclic phosphodiesterase [Paenibacillus sp. JX-17]